MKRVFALVLVVAYLAPMLAMAQTVPLVSVSTPNGGQPPNATVMPGANLPAVAVTFTASSAATISSITVQRVGSAPDSVVTKLTAVDTQNNTLGSATLSGGTATVPLSLSIPSGEARTVVVFATVAGNLTANQGQFFDINITAINTSAVVNGALPLFGAQLTLNSGVQKPTCQIFATPSTYTTGQTVTLKWQSVDATGGTITGLGSVGPSGQQGILPPTSLSSNVQTTYTGTFTGPGGTGTCSVPITFNPSNGSFVDPGGVDSGGSVGAPGAVGTPGSAGAGTVTPGQQTTVTPATTNGSTGPGIAQVCTGLNCQLCDFASLGQKIINFVIGFSIPIAALMFAWAGILYFTSASSLSNIERAKAALRVAFWGFLIAISAWLIIQTMLKFILNPQQYQSWNRLDCSKAQRAGTILGPNGNTTSLDKLFNSVFGQNGGLDTSKPGVAVGGYTSQYTSGQNQGYVGGDICGNCGAGYACANDGKEYWCQKNGTTFDPNNPNNEDNWKEVPGGGISGGSRGYAQCMTGNTNCDVGTLAGLGMTQTQANVMSCIAVTELSGNSVGCSDTNACGAFQITRGNWTKYAPSGCTAADFGGNITAAQNNVQCNQQVAIALMNANPNNPYQPWTGTCNSPSGCGGTAYGQPWNAAASTCVKNYANN
ncbi:MAG: pilin [Patescibacteria group bacterium]